MLSVVKLCCGVAVNERNFQQSPNLFWSSLALVLLFLPTTTHQPLRFSATAEIRVAESLASSALIYLLLNWTVSLLLPRALTRSS
jgi:hypothetical protein